MSNVCFTLNDCNVLEESENSFAKDICKVKERKFAKTIINYLLKNPYDEGGKEINHSNKDNDFECGLDA